MRTRTFFTTFTTTMVVATLAAAWALASPLHVNCALAEVPANITPAPNDSAQFVVAINQLRALHGLNALIVDPELTAIANNWADQMAQQDAISHRLDLRAGITAAWKTLGENVGVGPTVSQLMDAFIASPGHYKNLVDPRFTRVGVGSVRVPNGEMYTAHEFEGLQADSGGVVAPPATSAPVTTPRVRTTTAPQVTPAQVTPPVTTPPVTAPAPPPTTTTTTVPTPKALPTSVVLLPADHQLHDGSQNNQQQQKAKSNSRCRSHPQNLQAMVA